MVDMAGMMQIWRLLKQTLVIGVITLLLTVLVGELGVRLLVGAPLMERMPLVRVLPDPQTGFRMKPSDLHYTYQHKVQLNSLGLRGPELADPAAGRYRILALGDSHLYGQGIADEALLTTRLQEALQARFPRCQPEVVNAGVRAYSINQEFALLQRLQPQLQPDHVLLFFYLNDFDEVNIAARYRRYKGLDWYMPDLSGKPEGERLQRWQQMQGLRHSALLMWLHDLWRGLTVDPNHFEQKILRGATDKESEQRRAMVVSYLVQFKQLAQQQGFRFTLVIIPAAVQITHTFTPATYQAFLKAQAQRLGIAVVDLLPAFQADYQQRGQRPILPFDGHYNVRGQQLMAQQVMAYLQEQAPPCAQP
ncbi:lipolytic enzyme, G-D-S-L family [Magnetococcus marinus MC-1]|uniref:Lipolytic enzyme, G-D-S-L family n=2 Tax=Magnetococcus TaxID=162171 RepID=A0L6K4_MAGMM|nr:lipolytic enzyme, G-D-S-L family [Magnetococcus marinus MC-1]